MIRLLRFFLMVVFTLSVFTCSFGQNSTKKESSFLSTGWAYVPGASDETLSQFSIPDFTNATIIHLPHRLSLPNSVFWYRKTVKMEADAFLKINADDGAQVWVNGKRVLSDSDGLYPFRGSKDSVEIIIRVLNNAVAGGLRAMQIIPKTTPDRINTHQTAASAVVVPLMYGKNIIHPKKEKISFSFWGDSQGGWKIFSQFARNLANYDDDVSIGLGDLVADGSRTSEWTSLRKAIDPLQKKMPLFFIPGNHDYDGYYDDLLSKNYHLHITGDKAKKTYYDFYVGKAAFIALDPNCNFPLAIDTAQLHWMNNTMNSRQWQEADWRFVLIHQVPYGQGWSGYEGDHFIRTLIDTLAPSASIDFVLSGHIHDYERLTKKYGDQSTTFVISGGAGGGIEPIESNPVPVMDTLIKQHHVGRMELEKTNAKMYIYDLKGNIIDQLSIHKYNK